jgi:hypothetical protein
LGWKEGDGQMRTLFVKENGISQKMNYNGTLAAISWAKDTTGERKSAGFKWKNFSLKSMPP